MDIGKGSFRRTLYAKRAKNKEDNREATSGSGLLSRLEGKVKSKTLNKLKSIMGGKEKRYA